MKNSLLLFVLFIVVSCNRTADKTELPGTWDMVSVTDLETGEVTLPPEGEEAYFEITADSIFSTEGDAYAWQLEGDSIILDKVGSVFIAELTSNDLTVEFDFFGMTRLILKKRN